MKACINITATLAFIALSAVNSYSQISSGRVVYERRTNLEKLYGNVPEMKRFISDDNKIKNEEFELLFNDTVSAFLPIEKDEMERGMFAMLTTKNKTYQNINTGESMTVLDMMGNPLYVKEPIQSKDWKVTESKRYIAGYHCRKAVYDKDDTTRIYAWFAIELEPSIGPEGITGLPGAILGLATEDGGIVYFAKSIEVNTPSVEKLSYNSGKEDVYTKESFQKMIEERMGNSKWSKGMMANLFRW